MREVTDTALLNQLNGGQQSMPAGLRPVENEKILNQLNASDQSQQQEQPSVSNRAMSALLNQQSPFAPRSRPEEEKYWGTTEKVAGSLMDYAPFFIGGTGVTRLLGKALTKFPGTAEGLAKFASKNPKLAKYIPESMAAALGNAGYGAATAEDGERLSAAATNGIIGAAIPAVSGAIVDPLLRYGAQKYAQSAIPAFTEKAGKKLRELLPTSAYAKKLENRFLGASKKNKANWSNAEKSAKELDVLRGTSPFKQEPYQKYIQEYGENISKLEPALRSPYSQSIELAKNSGEMAPESFMGAMGLRKNINQTTKDYLAKQGNGISPTTYQSKDFLKGLKSNLKNETIDAQKGIVPEESLNVFKNQWEAANKSHQGVQEFYKTPQASSGVVKPTRQMRERFENVKNGGKLDPSVISKYVPSLSPQGSQGVEGLKQLAKVMGSKKAAVDAAKAHIFRKPIENGANTVDVAATYAKLSPSQKKYMFGNGDEGKMLEAINRTRLAFGREPEKTLAKIGHGMMSLGIPGGLGFAGGLASGESWDKSLMTGLATAAASKGIKGLAGRTATPGSVNRAIRFGQNGTTNFGRNANYIGQAYMNTPPEARR